MHDRIKVDGKTGQLGESVKINRDGTYGGFMDRICNDSTLIVP